MCRRLFLPAPAQPLRPIPPLILPPAPPRWPRRSALSAGLPAAGCCRRCPDFPLWTAPAALRRLRPKSAGAAPPAENRFRSVPAASLAGQSPAPAAAERSAAQWLRPASRRIAVRSARRRRTPPHPKQFLPPAELPSSAPQPPRPLQPIPPSAHPRPLRSLLLPRTRLTLRWRPASYWTPDPASGQAAPAAASKPPTVQPPAPGYRLPPGCAGGAHAPFSRCAAGRG